MAHDNRFKITVTRRASKSCSICQTVIETAKDVDEAVHSGKLPSDSVELRRLCAALEFFYRDGKPCQGDLAICDVIAEQQRKYVE